MSDSGMSKRQGRSADLGGAANLRVWAAALPEVCWMVVWSGRSPKSGWQVWLVKHQLNQWFGCLADSLAFAGCIRPPSHSFSSPCRSSPFLVCRLRREAGGPGKGKRASILPAARAGHELGACPARGFAVWMPGWFSGVLCPSLRSGG